MLARIQISFEAGKVAAALTREEWEDLRESVPTLGMTEWVEGKERPSWYYYSDNIYVDLEADTPVLAKYKIEFTVKQIKNTMKVAGKGQDGVTTNLHIALPNIGLLSIDEVTWMEDACTQELQAQLDDGWRLIAVCPPNGARRPDYILGRSRRG